MTLQKLLDIVGMCWRSDPSIKLKGSHIGCTGGGELCLDFNTQPSYAVHNYLIAKGFIQNATTYIYRPKK